MEHTTENQSCAQPAWVRGTADTLGTQGTQDIQGKGDTEGTPQGASPSDRCVDAFISNAFSFAETYGGQCLAVLCCLVAASIPLVWTTLIFILA